MQALPLDHPEIAAGKPKLILLPSLPAMTKGRKEGNLNG